MAKQKQWQKRATYVVVGPGRGERKMKYLDRFNVGKYEVIVFRFLKPTAQ